MNNRNDFGMTNDDSSLTNVFTNLSNINETKASNDQRRFREDTQFQSNVYQNFDTEADNRREGINSRSDYRQDDIETRARQQNSDLTKDRMKLQSTQNIKEEQNRGDVQVSTTGKTRNADLSRALSILPRR
jgi:hypothetical protein